MNSVNAQVVRKVDWGECCCVNIRLCVISIAALEAIGSLVGLVCYWYASYTYPMFKQFIVLPTEFLNDRLIVGLTNTLAILCAFEFVIALILLDGARYIRLGQIRFWLTTMFTYKILTIVTVVGMELAGCKAQRFNAFMFLSVFIRFLEMLFVYVFLEEETLKRMKLKTRRARQALAAATSNSNISEWNENNNDREHLIRIYDDYMEEVCTNPNPPVIESRRERETV